MSQPVHLSYEGETALIEIDNPPVNALSQSVRAGILAALDKAEADPAIRAIALFGKGKVFIAGADIKEFGKPPQAPILPDVINRLERSNKAVIAIVHGVALGGGLEVALGCHYRVALRETRLGLPEVKLGLLPGAGGTQRLPRLTGLAIAAEWITEGKLVDTEMALSSGLIDAISDAPGAREAALAVAQQWKAGAISMRKTGELPSPPADDQAIASLRQALQEQCPELYSPFRILDALAVSCTLPLEEGLKYERETFFECMDSPQRAGLIHHFFASKAIGKVPGAEPSVTLSALQLAGEHPVIEALSGHPLSQRSNDSTAGIAVHFRGAAEQATEVCEVALVDATGNNEPRQGFSLITLPGKRLLELVDHEGAPALQQAIMKVLAGAGFRVIPSRKQSLYSVLNAAVQGAEDRRAALEDAALAAVDAGLCYRPEDIDVLAIDALDYPAHLGGPHFQAKLRA